MQSIDYVTKDFEGFRQIMLSQIPLVAPEWTDTSPSDMGIVLMELLAYGLDILSFYQDKAVNESFLPTARARKSVINICRLLGYTLKQQQPSKHKIVFRKLPQYKDKEIIVRAGTMLGTDPSQGVSILFEVDRTIVIPAGVIGDEKDSEGNYIHFAMVTHGRTVTDIVGTGDGTASQRFNLNYPNALKDTITVWTEENGIMRYWTRVDDFLDSTEKDRNFISVTDELNKTYIEFGDSYTGMVIKKNTAVNTSYRVGGGTIGNVGLNTINTFMSSEIVGIQSFGNPETPAVYGTNVESLDSAKLLAPRMFRTNNRCVTVSDFEAFSCSVNGVDRAKCIETFNESGDVLIYITNLSHTPTSVSFKKEVKDFLDSKRLINNTVIVLDAEYKEYDIVFNIETYPDYANEDIKTQLLAEVGKYLDVKNFDFGQDLILSDLIREVKAKDIVYDVRIPSPVDNVLADDTQVLKLKSLTINVTGGID